MGFAFEPAGIPYPFSHLGDPQRGLERTTDSDIKSFGSVAKKAFYCSGRIVAAVAQLVERILGKDEVMGPNPISS